MYRRNPTSVTYNGNYKKDTGLFYKKFEQLLGEITNESVKKSMEYRISQYKNKIIDW